MLPTLLGGYLYYPYFLLLFCCPWVSTLPSTTLPSLKLTQLTLVSLDYTRCRKDAPGQFADYFAGNIVAWKYESGVCSLRFTVPETLQPNVYMYVGITNMFQNHRLYIKSYDSDQLNGKVYQKASDIPNSLTSCAFLQYANCDTAAKHTWIGNGLTHAECNPDCLAKDRSAVIAQADADAQYYPCGLIANSYFTGRRS